MQKGENLWVQNFLNHTAGGAAANETQPSGGAAAAANETLPEGNQTQPVGPEINANQTQPVVNIINETVLNQTTVQNVKSKFLVGEEGQAEPASTSSDALGPTAGAGGQGQAEGANATVPEQPANATAPSGGAKAPEELIFSRYIFVAGQNVTLM